MTYRGHVQNGVVILANGAMLPEGAEVRVEMIDVPVGHGGATFGRLKCRSPNVGESAIDEGS